ncbi:MAG: hypothetical protein VKK04_26540 [Synechococcales bacterium]|nr:hypothetical protein [Synechococcales bacterium]
MAGSAIGMAMASDTGWWLDRFTESAGGIFQSVEGITDAVIISLLERLQDAVYGWLAAHPLVLWMVIHPVWSLVGALLALWLILGLFQAIAHYIQQGWLFLLRAPYLLIRWLVGLVFISLQTRSLRALPPAQSAPEIGPDRLVEILNRLEDIRQEETELMQEMRSLLAHEPTPK